MSNGQQDKQIGYHVALVGVHRVGKGRWEITFGMDSPGDTTLSVVIEEATHWLEVIGEKKGGGDDEKR
jgi:hypothetical protein